MKRHTMAGFLTIVALGLGVWGPALLFGAETAAFLKVSPGARPIGMGEAFTAVADDLNALAWNPAGLAALDRKEAAFMHAELFADTRYDFIGYGHPLGGYRSLGTVALGLSRLSQGAIQGRDENRRPSGSFQASDTAFQVAFSRRIGVSGPMLGISGKYLESAIADVRARTGAVDVGFLHSFRGGPLPLSLGVSALNVGPGMRFLDRREDLPLTLSVGAGLRLFPGVLVAVDARHRPNAAKSTFGVGLEYTMLSALILRAGYGSGLASVKGDSAGVGSSLRGLGAGLGLRLGRAQLDYSFTPAGELGNSQRISLSMRFGAVTGAPARRLQKSAAHW